MIRQRVAVGTAALAFIAIVIVLVAGVVIVSLTSQTASQTAASAQTISTATFTSVSNSSDNLRFSLELTHDSDGNLTIEVDELNLLGSVNNVTGSNAWGYNYGYLNPFDGCPVGLFDGFAIASGYYGENNFTTASTLRLYDAAMGYMSCTTTDYPNMYAFQSMSDNATIIDPSLRYDYTLSSSLSDSLGGYWNASGSSFQRFPAGAYTVIGADQWGNVLLLHFTVVDG